MHTPSALRKLLVVTLACTALCGCIKNTRLSGYTPETDKFDKLVPGETRKAAVQKELGSPSAVSTYGDIWYYVSTEQETIAFLKPKIKSQRVVEISFDENQTVKTINRFNENDARDIKITRDTTTTETHDTGILGQLLGNVGRFNSEGRDLTQPRTGGGRN